MENGVGNSTFYILHSTFSKRAGEGAVMPGLMGNRLAARFFGEVRMGGKERGHAISVLLRFVRASGIDKAASRRYMRGGGGQDGILLCRKVFQPFLRPAPTCIGAAAQHARVGAGSIDQHAIELAKHSLVIFRCANGFYPIKMKTGKIRA